MGHLSLHTPSGAASMAWHGDPNPTPNPEP